MIPSITIHLICAFSFLGLGILFLSGYENCLGNHKLEPVGEIFGHVFMGISMVSFILLAVRGVIAFIDWLCLL